MTHDLTANRKRRLSYVSDWSAASSDFYDFEMRAAVRQFGSWSLIAAYTLLWMGGSAWHGVSCCDHQSCHQSAEETCHSHSQQQSCCRHHHAHCQHSSSSQNSDSPAAPDHDNDDCQICRWVGQAQAPVTLVILLSSGELSDETQPLPNRLVAPRFVACYESRGPPLCFAG